MSRTILCVVFVSSAGCSVRTVGELKSEQAVADAPVEDSSSGGGSSDSEGSGDAGSTSLGTTHESPTATSDDDSGPPTTSGAEPPPEVTAYWEEEDGGVLLRIAFSVDYDLCSDFDFGPNCASVKQWHISFNFDAMPVPGEYDIETLTGWADVVNPKIENGCTGSGAHELGSGTLRIDAVGDDIEGGLLDTIVLDGQLDATDPVTVDFVAPFCIGW